MNLMMFNMSLICYGCVQFWDFVGFQEEVGFLGQGCNFEDDLYFVVGGFWMGVEQGIKLRVKGKVLVFVLLYVFEDKSRGINFMFVYI